MSEHDASRREFLRAAVGAGTVAGAGIVPEALAQTREQDKKSTPETNAPPHSQSNGEGLGAFLNRDDAATVAAFTERLMPGAPGKPGARDAGVLNYIDLALAGAYADQQDFYRRGLAALDAHCRTAYNKPFAQLSAAQQDEVITALEAGKATGFTPSSDVFFRVIHEHTLQGMFGDPVYGGNKNFAGWDLIGYPGVKMPVAPGDQKIGVTVKKAHKSTYADGQFAKAKKEALA